jgi:hypothetical protein
MSRLQVLSKNAKIIPGLLEYLHASPEAQVRQLAALLLRKKIMVNHTVQPIIAHFRSPLITLGLFWSLFTHQLDKHVSLLRIRTLKNTHSTATQPFFFRRLQAVISIP